jgi:hypothetical protein
MEQLNIRVIQLLHVVPVPIKWCCLAVFKFPPLAQVPAETPPGLTALKVPLVEL